METFVDSVQDDDDDGLDDDFEEDPITIEDDNCPVCGEPEADCTCNS
jgi:hypothetical protein